MVGHAPTISAGAFVQSTGTWANDRTHGLQFKARFLRAAPPTTVEGIEKYLGSGMIRGIGPVYGKRLVRAFSAAVFEGIGPKRAGRIVAGRATGGPGVGKTTLINSILRVLAAKKVEIALASCANGPRR